MTNFCKLFDTDRGQILVKLDRNDEGDPEVRLYAQPEELGVCSIAATYEDDDAGWDKAEAYFASIDEVAATRTTTYLFELMKGQE